MTPALTTYTAPELAVLIARWNKAYYNGQSEVSDDVWQAHRDQLKKLDPSNPLLKEIGAKVDTTNTLAKVTHAVRVGSLDNSFDESGIEAWVNRCNKLIKDAGY